MAEHHNKTRDADLEAFAEAYRLRQAQLIDEQIAEQRADARAAQCPCIERVNLFTGDRTARK